MSEKGVGGRTLLTDGLCRVTAQMMLFSIRMEAASVDQVSQLFLVVSIRME